MKTKDDIILEQAYVSILENEYKMPEGLKVFNIEILYPKYEKGTNKFLGYDTHVSGRKHIITRFGHSYEEAMSKTGLNDIKNTEKYKLISERPANQKEYADTMRHADIMHDYYNSRTFTGD